MEHRFPCQSTTVTVGPKLYANMVPQSRVIEYYQVREDDVRSPDGEDAAAEPCGIDLAMREIHANLFFSTASARLAGEHTRPQKRMDYTLAESGKMIRLWIGQQADDVRNTLLAYHHKGSHDRLAGLIASLADMRGLEDGWNCYSAPAPSNTAIKNAKALSTAADAQDIIPQRVEPSAMGGVGVTFSLDNREVSVEFYNDGTAHALFADNAAEEMDTQADATGYRSLLREVRPYLYGNSQATAPR